MSNIAIDVRTLSLDHLGRVVLPDAVLEQIEVFEDTLVAGGANLHCNGTANASCTNASCGNTANGLCTNQVSCSGSANLVSCNGFADEPPHNTDCA